MAGAKPVSAVSRSAATAWPEDFRCCICAWIASTRSTGSAMPTGSSANMAETLLS